jgi:hypothetical protein
MELVEALEALVEKAGQDTNSPVIPKSSYITL